jgi:hypothetical protein
VAGSGGSGHSRYLHGHEESLALRPATCQPNQRQAQTSQPIKHFHLAWIVIKTSNRTPDRSSNFSFFKKIISQVNRGRSLNNF